MLRTTVLVRRITNLSDARYCAGMGVELLGFPLTGPEALLPAAVRELAGWVSGIQRVGEVDGSLAAEEINALATACELDFILLTDTAAHPDTSVLSRPVIRVVPYAGLGHGAGWGTCAYLVLTEVPSADPAALASLAKQLELAPAPVLLALVDPTPQTALAALERMPTLAGLTLAGGHEIRPGLRDFAHLAEVLEALETD